MKAKQAGLFLTPEETHPSRAVKLTGDYLTQTEAAFMEHGFIMALVDPIYNALACALSTSRHLSNSKNQQLREQLINHYQQVDLEKINKEQQLAILEDPFILAALHRHIWRQQEKYDKLFTLWQNECQQ
jgi:Membrane glycosyltransferase